MAVNADDAKTLRHFLASPPIGAVLDDGENETLHALPVTVKNFAPHSVVSSQGIGPTRCILSEAAGDAPIGTLLMVTVRFLTFRCGAISWVFGPGLALTTTR